MYCNHIYHYLKHRFTAKNTRGHGVHSPFLYAFTQEVIYEKNPFYVFSSIEQLRNMMRKESRTIQITDYGTGKNHAERKVADIAHSSLKRKKWAQLLFRLVNFSKAENVLELGTSLGITTAYLASANSNIRCITLEGSPQTAAVARANFEKLGRTNIRVVEGNINETLPRVLEDMERLDVVFFDANHRKMPTVDYFNRCLPLATEESVFIFDDIYWSNEMTEAWKEIKKNKKITSTIDLFEIGIVFFNKNLPKKNYKMSY